MESRGEIDKATVDEWERETKKREKKLPKKAAAEEWAKSRKDG